MATTYPALTGSAASSVRDKRGLIPLANHITKPGIGGGGGNAYDSAAQDAAFDALFNTRLAAHGTAGTVYVRKTGNDGNSGTNASPVLTIGRGLQLLAAGGTLIIGDGVYDDAANWISTQQRTIPNGTSGNWTVIRAENRFGVRIRMTAAPSGYGDAPIYLGTGKQYIHIDGIICESTFTASTGDGNDNGMIDSESATAGPYIIISRCPVKRKSCDQYGSSYIMGEGHLYLLTGHFGSSRYAYFSGSGGSGLAVQGSIVRLSYNYMPFGPSREPTAVFSFYGNSGGTNVSNQPYLNAYSFKSPHIPHKTGQATEALKWGDWYFVKGIDGVMLKGCGVIDCGGEYGAYSFDNDSGWTSTHTIGTLDDCFIAGYNNGSAAGAQGVRKYPGFGNLTINHVTAQGMPGSAFPSDEWTGANNLTSSALYPVQRVGSNGCEQKYVLGPLFSFRGDTDWDQPQTGLKLFPLPYESYFKALFQETITRVTQDVPTTFSTSQDIFSGTRKDGGEKTLTSILIEAFDNQMPSLAPGAGFY